MIQEAFTYVEQIQDMDTKLKLIDTLISVTAGKVLYERFISKCHVISWLYNSFADFVTFSFQHCIFLILEKFCYTK